MKRLAMSKNKFVEYVLTKQEGDGVDPERAPSALYATTLGAGLCITPIIMGEYKVIVFFGFLFSMSVYFVFFNTKYARHAKTVQLLRLWWLITMLIGPISSLPFNSFRPSGVQLIVGTILLFVSYWIKIKLVYPNAGEDLSI